VFRGYLREGPKFLRREFYNYDKDLNEVVNSINFRSILAIEGLKRIGKTSLVLTAYSEIAKRKSNILLIHADFRGVTSRDSALTIILRGYEISKKILDMISCLRSVIVKRFRSKLIDKLAKEIKSSNREFNVKLFKLRKSSIRRLRSLNILTGFRDVLEVINDVASELGFKCIVFLDEVHEVFGHVKNSRDELAQSLAYAYDYLDNVKVIVSGSRVRLLEEFLSHEALTGRTSTIKMTSLGPEDSIDMLDKGLKDNRVPYELRTLIVGYELSWGIAGWLTTYGRIYVEAYRMYRDISKATKYAREKLVNEMKIACSEELRVLKRYSKGVKTYEKTLKVLKYIGKGVTSFNDLMRLTELNSGTLNTILRRLERYGFIERVDNEIKLLDPSIKTYVIEAL